MTLASALTFSHQKGTIIQRVVWDFVEIEWNVAGVWTLITQSPIQWDNKNNETVYFHSSGTQANEYRFRFYNSVTASYSEYSPTLTGAGFARNQVGEMIKNVRVLTNDLDRKYIEEDVQIVEFFNAAQDIIYGRNPKYWFLLVDAVQRGISIACLANTSVYSLASLTNYGHLESLRFDYNNGATHIQYPLEFKGAAEFDKLVTNLTTPTTDYADFFKLLPADSSSANGYVKIFPTIKTTNVATLYPNYYEKLTELDSVDDATQVPMPRILEHFAIAEVERIKGNETKATVYENLFFGPADMAKSRGKLTGLALLDSLDQAAKRPSGQPQRIKFMGRNPDSSINRIRMYTRDYIRENFM